MDIEMIKKSNISPLGMDGASMLLGVNVNDSIQTKYDKKEQIKRQ